MTEHLKSEVLRCFASSAVSRGVARPLAPLRSLPLICDREMDGLDDPDHLVFKSGDAGFQDKVFCVCFSGFGILAMGANYRELKAYRFVNSIPHRMPTDLYELCILDRSNRSA